MFTVRKEGPKKVTELHLFDNGDGSVNLEDEDLTLLRINSDGTVTLFDGVEGDQYKTDRSGRLKVVNE